MKKLFLYSAGSKAVFGFTSCEDDEPVTNQPPS